MGLVHWRCPGLGWRSAQPPWVLALWPRLQALPRLWSAVTPRTPSASRRPKSMVWSSWLPRAGWSWAGAMLGAPPACGRLLGGPGRRPRHRRGLHPRPGRGGQVADHDVQHLELGQLVGGRPHRAGPARPGRRGRVRGQRPVGVHHRGQLTGGAQSDHRLPRRRDLHALPCGQLPPRQAQQPGQQLRPRRQLQDRRDERPQQPPRQTGLGVRIGRLHRLRHANNCTSRHRQRGVAPNRSHRADHPPSEAMVCPVIQLASSLSSHVTRRAASVGVLHRPVGCIAATDSRSRLSA